MGVPSPLPIGLRASSPSTRERAVRSSPQWSLAPMGATARADQVRRQSFQSAVSKYSTVRARSVVTAKSVPTRTLRIRSCVLAAARAVVTV